MSLINDLLDRLRQLENRQDKMRSEISAIRTELEALINAEKENQTQTTDFTKEEIRYPFEEIKNSSSQPVKPSTPPEMIAAFSAPSPRVEVPKKEKSSLERWIGENLISKIGILVTIIGVIIGTRYAIDHDLISPLARIILGYMLGTGILFAAYKLKEKYHAFSAVLLSGSMVINYFITFAAYAFYGILPREITFGLMFIFTAFTVLSAVKYNEQLIAILGLTGAYAIPFMLSNNSGQAAYLFTYMTIVNSGIVFLSFRKNWKPLFYSSFGITWVIYGSWFIAKNGSEHFNTAFLFATIFFLLFYIVFLANKVVKVEKFNAGDIVLLILNSLIYFGAGYALLSTDKDLEKLSGLFAIGNAVIHTIACYYIYRRNLGDKRPLYLVAAMVITFLTIAVPVQLHGRWITMTWGIEAFILYFIGKSKNTPLFKTFAMPLIVLAVLSLSDDWAGRIRLLSNDSLAEIPFLNLTFCTGLLLSVSFFLIAKWQRSISGYDSGKSIFEILEKIIPGIAFLLVSYFFIRNEIHYFYLKGYWESKLTINRYGSSYDLFNTDYLSYSRIWILNYSIIYCTSIYFYTRRFKVQSPSQEIAAVFIALGIVTFLIDGLATLGNLRYSYLTHPEGAYYTYSVGNIIIRYISLAFCIVGLYAIRHYGNSEDTNQRLKKVVDIFIHGFIVIFLSSELINWLDLTSTDITGKMELSILWGTYSLFLIILGIRNKQKHIRIAAIALFGITLAKLFLFDLNNLSTLAKTVAMILLGVLLLVISFLYNKYKHLLEDEQNS